MRKRYSHRHSQPFLLDFESNKSKETEQRNNFFISQIVYPKNLLECNDLSFLVGWNTEQFDCTIAGIIPVTTFDPNPIKCAAIITEAIQGVFQTIDYPLSHIKWQGNQQPMILGIYRPSTDLSQEKHQIDNFAQQFQSNGIWITLTKESSTSSSKISLKLSSIFSLGYRYETVCYLMEYEPLPSNHFYQVLTTAYYPRQFLYPTYFITTTQTDLLKYINIEKKFDSDLSSLFHPMPTTINNNTSNRKPPPPSSEKRSTALMKMENIRIILTQLNASEMFLFLLFSRLEEIMGKSLTMVLESNSTITDPTKVYLTHYLQHREFLKNNSTKLLFYQTIVTILRYIVMVWTYFILVLEKLLRTEIPFLRTILYFCDWKEIAPAQVTLRENDNDITNSSKFEGKRRLASSSSSSVWMSTLSNYCTRCFSFHQWYQHFHTSLPSLSSTTAITDSPYALYRFSFFFNELIQTIEQYHVLLDLFQQLFSHYHPGRTSTYSTTTSSSTTFISPNFSRKYYYLQIIHHLIYLILNAGCGFIISYYLHQIDQHLLLQYVIDGFHMLRQTMITDSLHWIESSPLGIKLNAYFVEKVNYLIQMVIQYYYSYWLVHYYYYRYTLLFFQFFFLYFPFSGITYQISLILDLCMIMSLPLNTCYFVFTAMFHMHSHLLSSLWLFFQGRKYNIFRQRIDTYVFTTTTREMMNTEYQSYYHANQLLFGVLLFSIMFFLLPTIFIFYCYFLILRMGMIVIYFVGWNLMMIVKKFPIVYYCSYIMDYLFFTNRWQLEVEIPKESTIGKESISYPTIEKTVGIMKQRKLKHHHTQGGVEREQIATEASFRKNKENIKVEESRILRVESSDQSHPSEISTDSEANNEKKDLRSKEKEKLLLSIQPPSPAALFLKRPGQMILPDYPSPSHQKLRNRKNLMISLTEKYRKEEDEEEAVPAVPLGSEVVSSSHSPDLYSVSSINHEDNKVNETLSETSPNPATIRQGLYQVPDSRKRSNESPFFKSASIDDGEVLLTSTNEGKKLSGSLSDYSDELSITDNVTLDQTMPVPDIDTPASPPIPFPSTPSSSSTTILSKGYSIAMKFIPVPFNLQQLLLCTITLFLTSPFQLLNEVPRKYSFQSVTTRQKIIKFLQTILLSYPLFVIFEHNSLRLTIFTASRHLETGDSDSGVIMRRPIHDLLSTDSSFSTTEEQQRKPFHYYYRQRLLAMISMIYSFYFLAFIFGLTLLLYYHTSTFQYLLWFGSSNISHSHSEELTTLEITSNQRVLVNLAITP